MKRTCISTVVLVLSSTMGCTVEVPTFDSTQVESISSRPTIFGGVEDNDDRSTEGVVAVRTGFDSSSFGLCTGALIATNVVLTARHCVSKVLTEHVSCNRDGNSLNGDHVDGDVEPSSIGIYSGASPYFGGSPRSRAISIFTTNGKNLCDLDIAIIVLETPITDIGILPVRLKSPAIEGEKILSVGYGKNDKDIPTGNRFRRSNVSVLTQGRTKSPTGFVLGAHEFEADESSCSGDSGGPAISEATGAIIGVVSRGGNCSDNFGHVYTTTAGFGSLFADAFHFASATLRVEENGPTSHPQPFDGGGCQTGRSRTNFSAIILMVAMIVLGMKRRRL